MRKIHRVGRQVDAGAVVHGDIDRRRFCSGVDEADVGAEGAVLTQVREQRRLAGGQAFAGLGADQGRPE